MDEELAYTDVTGLVRRIATGEVSPTEVISAILARIERLNPLLNCYLSLNPAALDEARNFDRRKSAGERPGPLAGVPLSVKDLILTHDLPTTAGSKVYGKGITARKDAPVVAALKAAGAIHLGKTNLQEFAYGVTNENEHFGPARNPWAPSRICGGSSGGSAAALAAGLCHISLGTDTRGSIRIPSACCGTTGLKPTRGLVPTGGVIPLSWSLDHVGPMSRSARDLRLILPLLTGSETAGPDPPRTDLRTLRVGLCPYYFQNLDTRVAEAISSAVDVLAGLGAEIREVKMGSLDSALEASDVIAKTEAITFHHRHLLAKPEAYGPKVRARLEGGYSVSGREFVEAQRARARTTREFRAVFESTDLLLAPALPIPAPPLGTSEVQIDGRSEWIVRSFVRLNAPQNMAGVPALVMPCGLSEKEKLPIGVQLIGWRNRDSLLIEVAELFQSVTGWHQCRPPLR